MLWFEHMFRRQWASRVWGSLWSEESICTGSWSNSGCGNPSKVRKAFVEEGGPTQGAEPKRSWEGFQVEVSLGRSVIPSGENSSLYRRQ